MRKLFQLATPLTLGILAAIMLGCSSGSSLIPANDASSLLQDLDKISSDIDAGKCDQAAESLSAFGDEVAALPPSLNRKLRARLNEGIENLTSQLDEQCVDRTTTTETTTTETTTTETVPTETVPTETVPTTTETVTEPTVTVPTITEPTVTVPTTDPGGGQQAPSRGIR